MRGFFYFTFMAKEQKVRSGKLILRNEYNKTLLYYPKTDEERKSLAKSSFSWSGEDYRQNEVAPSVEGAMAKPEEFMPFYFRHLSATIVGAWSWKATEFTPEVLKKAAKLLTHKPVYVNHELEVGNIVGVNGDISFVGKSKAADGTQIPEGLEGAIWLDARLQKDLCRKLTSYPVPQIQSVSVTVTYNWVPSHEFQGRDGEPDDWEFEMRIGTLVDGKMVRRIVTEITDFYETSFVFLGADPFAKILVDGKPFNIETEAIVGAKQFDADPLCDLYKKENVMFISGNGMDDKNVLSLKRSAELNFSKTGKLNPQKENNEEKISEMEKIIIAALAKKLGKKEEEITPEIVEQFTFVSTEDYARLSKAETELKTEKDAKVKAEGELKTANETIEKFGAICKADELEAFEKEVALSDVRSMAKFGKSVISAKREEAVKYYKLSVGAGNEKQAVIDNINSSTEEVLDGMLEQYGKSVRETFGAKCEKCGSEKIQFRSSQSEPEGGKTEIEEPRLAHVFRK